MPQQCGPKTEEVAVGPNDSEMSEKLPSSDTSDSELWAAIFKKMNALMLLITMTVLVLLHRVI